MVIKYLTVYYLTHAWLVLCYNLSGPVCGCLHTTGHNFSRARATEMAIPARAACALYACLNCFQHTWRGQIVGIPMLWAPGMAGNQLPAGQRQILGMLRDHIHVNYGM